MTTVAAVAMVVLTLYVIGEVNRFIDRQLGSKRGRNQQPAGFTPRRSFSWNVPQNAQVAGITVHQKLW